MAKKRVHRLEILLTEEELNKLEKLSKKFKKPKGRILRDLALISLEDAEFFDKIGLFDLALKIRELKEKAFEVYVKSKKIQSVRD